VQTSAFRVEVIRFSLLVVLTVALLSVAIRLASHSESHQSLQPGPRETTSTVPSGSTAPTTAGPTTSGPSSPVTTPSTAPRTAGATPAPHTAPGSGGGSAGGSSGQSGQQTQPVLPVTGYDAALKLAALSMVLIGAGALTVRSSRR